MTIDIATAARLGRKAGLALGIAALASVVPVTPAAAQTVPEVDLPGAGLDLPANLQIFGKQDPHIRKPTAIVNDVVITGTDVDQRVALIVALNSSEREFKLEGEERERLRLQVLRALIDETLQIEEAKANKIEMTRDEIDASFARVAKNFNRTPDQMRAWLREVGSSERSVRRQIEGELAWGRLLRRRVQIEVSEAEVNQIIEKMKADKGTPEYHLFEIYVRATPDESEKVYQAEKRMIEQLKQGVPFGYLARTYSQATTRARDGDLGWIRLATMPEQIARVGEQLEVGQIAGPIEVPGGFSILYLADKRAVLTADPRDATLSLKQIAVAFPEGTTEAQAQQRASQFAEATSKMQGCGDAARTAAAVGGTVIDNQAIRIRQLPDALANMIAPLQVGQATQPFGSIEEGVRVLVICGRDDPPQVAAVPSAEDVSNELAERRTNLRAARILRDLRRDALIEYR